MENNHYAKGRIKLKQSLTSLLLLLTAITITSLVSIRPAGATLIIHDFWFQFDVGNVQSSQADIIYHERNSGFAFYWEEGPTFENDGHMFGDVGGFIEAPKYGEWDMSEDHSYTFESLQDAGFYQGTTELTGMESFDVIGYFGFWLEYHDPLGDIHYGNYSLNLDPATFTVYETPNDVWVEAPSHMPSVNFDFYGKDYRVALIYRNGTHGNWDAEMSLAPVPEPATMLLLGSGLIGLAGFRRKYKK